MKCIKYIKCERVSTHTIWKCISKSHKNLLRCSWLIISVLSMKGQSFKSMKVETYNAKFTHETQNNTYVYWFDLHQSVLESLFETQSNLSGYS